MKSKTASAAPKTKTIDQETGVILERVNGLSVDTYLHKLKLDGTGSITDRVHRLNAFLRPRLGKETTGLCDCGGRSDSRFEACPFCGDKAVDGTIPPGDEAIAIAELIAKDPSMPPAPERDARAEARAATELSKETPAQPLVPARRRRRGEPETTVVPPADVEVVPAMTGPDVLSQTPHESIVDHLPGDLAVVATEAALPTPVEDVKATVDQLDASVAKIHTLIGKTFESTYDLGKELDDNYSRKLWLQRRNDGKPAYASWTEFVAKEIPVGLQYTYKLMTVTRRFDRDAFRTLSIRKLLLIVRVPEDDDRLPDVIEQASKLSTADLKSRVTELTGDRIGLPRAETEVGKLIADKLWSEAAGVLSRAYEAANKSLAETAMKMGVEVRSVQRWFSMLEEQGFKIQVSAHRDLRAKARATKAEEKKAKKAPPPELKKSGKAPPIETRQSAKAPPPEGKKKAPPAAPLLMVPVRLGKTRIPLLIRPKKRNDAPKQAKRVVDDPWAVEHLENGVTVRYVVHMTPKGMELIIDRTKS